MINKEVINDHPIDETILEKHITDYIHGMGFIITGAFIFLFVADMVVSIVVYFGHLPFHLQSITGGTATYREFLTGQIITQTVTLIPFLIYFLLYNKVNFNCKKTLLCVLTITSTAVLCFSHWKNPYISFLFAIPVVITSPLDKKRNRITLAVSEILIIAYAFFHNNFHDPEINFLAAAVASTTLGMFFVISLKIHSTMDKLFIEVKEYKNTQEILYDKIAHDLLTGAFSKSALETHMENLGEYKTLAFLDVDNFKEINDKKGHHTGDSILKILVICLKSKDIDIYRYGGDEFVILSKKYSPRELEEILKISSQKLSLTSKELYSCRITLSIGIISINPKKTPSENIQDGDRQMYISKNTGRNKITVRK